MRTHDFRQSIEVGRQGEILISEYLKNHKNVVKIEDVSDNPTYQDSDIDLIVEFANGKKGTIEIKTLLVIFFMKRLAIKSIMFQDVWLKARQIFCFIISQKPESYML